MIEKVFPVGCRVRLSQEARTAFPQSPTAGIVVGYSRERLLVKVRLDGRKTPLNFHPDFIERRTR